MTEFTPIEDRLLSKKEVADRLGVHTATVDRWEKAGTIPAKVRIGGRVGWRAEAVQAFIAAL